MKHLIEFANEQATVAVSPKLKMLLSAAICKTLARFSLPLPAVISVTLVDNNTIREINKQHRSIDASTDVLSFPLLCMTEGQLCTFSDADTDDGRLPLGDIVLSAEQALLQAKEYGHSTARELAYLTVHSTLHLLGYDHMKDDEQQRMRAMEETVLSAMGLTR